jgi:phosphatidylglycerol lysyltransferase
MGLVRILLRLRPLWPWIVLLSLTALGWHELRRIDLSLVRGILSETPGDLLLALLAASALNLCLAGFYDVAALGPLDRPPPLGERWKVGFFSFAWSNFLTVGPLAGPALRLWLYRPLGVTGERARSALWSILASFSITLLVWCGAAAIPLPSWISGSALHLLLAAPVAAAAALLLTGLSRLPRIAALFGEEWRPTALAAVSALDWFLAWWVFHLALNGLHGQIPLAVSFRSFFTGQLLGLLSFVPGGFGAADAYWVSSLAGFAGGHDRVVAALILYRAVYYVIPWTFATVYLAGHLLRTGRRTSAFLRTAIASYTFLCGAVLLASASAPTLGRRMAFLTRMVPLTVVEVSHGLSVVLGFLLLTVSRGLARGYRSSFRMALALFLAGALAIFLKGFDYEEAALSLLAAAVLLLCHRSFPRKGSLRPSVEYAVTIGLFAVMLFSAVGYGSYGALPGFEVAFSRFAYRAQKARFLRGLVLLVSLAAVAALRFAFRSRVREVLPDRARIDAALADARAWSASTTALLVATGDKAIWRPGDDGDGEPGPGEPARGFIVYRTIGRYLVAFSDPVSPPGGERTLLAGFLDHASSLDREVVLYQISPAILPLAHDFGFTIFKLGEEALVDLTRFDLQGRGAKGWRRTLREVERAGGRFEVVGPERLAPLIPEMKSVSDAWLEKKQGLEKGFSLGRFDPEYLLRFPAALARDGSGRIAGFANVLEGAGGAEMSIDLMRYRPGPEGVPGVMEYLLLELMLRAKESGFQRFNLGMAPLSAVGEERRARSRERLARLFFRHGEHWFNYQGLRRYKEKFDPRWEPRYLAYPRPWDWPLAAASTAVLIAGGWRRLFLPGARRRKRRAPGSS